MAVLAGWLALGVCAAVLLWDVTRLQDTYAFPRLTNATNISEAAEHVGRARAINAVIGDATRELGAGDVGHLIVPTDLNTLIDVEADVFAGREQATLDARLMRPFLGVQPTVMEYDAELTDAEVLNLERVGIAEYPLGVHAVLTPEGEPPRFVLFGDSTGTRVYVVPESLAPRGVPEERDSS